MKENISSIKIVEDTVLEGTIKSTNKKFKTYIPEEIQSQQLANELLKQADEGKLQLTGAPKPTTPWFFEILPSLFMLFFVLILWFVFMNQSLGGGGKVMNFGKSKAKVHKDDEKKRVTFKDLAGLNEDNEDLQEVVDFLKNP